MPFLHLDLVLAEQMYCALVPPSALEGQHNQESVSWMQSSVFRIMLEKAKSWLLHTLFLARGLQKDQILF